MLPGSASGPLAVHLARHERIKFGEEIEIRQGTQIRRPSVLYARADGTADAIERVIIGGRAVNVARRIPGGLRVRHNGLDITAEKAQVHPA